MSNVKVNLDPLKAYRCNAKVAVRRNIIQPSPTGPILNEKMTEEETDPFVVLLSLDASQQALSAIQYYLDHIHKRCNHVICTHVVELPDKAHPREAFMSPATMAECWKDAERTSTNLREKTIGMLKKRGVEKLTFQVKRGLKPGPVIVSAAADTKARMIVVGSRGVGTIRRTLLGSVSDYVIHHCDIPVVVVPGKTE
ncbi:hypothetical protein LSAT2_027201 [Lamellibrachia satsuma]|nr:hypothetical protein LSAT2_027201 [Lamellibrachia satsuma]